MGGILPPSWGASLHSWPPAEKFWGPGELASLHSWPPAEKFWGLGEFVSFTRFSNVEERADSSEREIGDSCEREIRAVGVILSPAGES